MFQHTHKKCECDCAKSVGLCHWHDTWFCTGLLLPCWTASTQLYERPATTSKRAICCNLKEQSYDNNWGNVNGKRK
eukprot:2919059-Amphidinium_carterae.1